MMAFFFTMPISSMMPMIEITLRSILKSISASMAPDAGRGQRGDDGERMHQALVENSEHNVDRQQRGGDQDRFCVPSEVW